MLRLILHWLSIQTKCAYWMFDRVDRYKGGTGVLYNNKFSNKLWTYAGVRASREYLNKFSSVVKFNISNEHALGWWPPKMKNQNLSSLNKFFKVDHIFILFSFLLVSWNEFLKECPFERRHFFGDGGSWNFRVFFTWGGPWSADNFSSSI